MMGDESCWKMIRRMRMVKLKMEDFGVCKVEFRENEVISQSSG